MLRNVLLGVIAGAVICLAGQGAALAEDTKALLNEDAITQEKLKSFFDAAFLNASVDKDGDLKVEDGGFKTFVKVDKEKKLVTYFAAWGMKKSVSDLKKLRFVNSLNDDLIFVRFSMPRPQTLWCDYQFSYAGGLTPFAIINNYRLFAKVVRGAVSAKDPDGIIGSD